jgi:malto-oligosyltrehalose trehalohydrolase
MKRTHVMPFGAEVLEGSVRFRLWAPGAKRVDVCLEEAGTELVLPMQARQAGWFELSTDHAKPGSQYRFRIDGELRVPDPASRFQPKDVHGPSEVIDPAAWTWEDDDWRGRPWEEVVLYELHAGAFNAPGGFAAVMERLDYLADLGVTAVELMPVADFPGRCNWGYDGVLLFAPDSSYGRPEDLKALVEAAHARGLMVFLDVVYNHFGPEGNYLHAYAPQFFTERHHTPWGAAINFDGPQSRQVRDFFIHNALYWIEEYHIDGLRLDAVHAILDDSQPDILQELAEAVNRGPGAQRHVHLVLENDDNAARYLAREADGAPRWYRAQWNDDIHHALHVLTTGEDQGYYADYAAAPARHLGRCLAEGFAYQGDPSAYRDGARRGEPSRGLPPTAFVNFLQNHDQVGNRAFGERIDELASAAARRTAWTILLLAPSPPLLFMGQELAAAQPFPFFCDFGPELAALVTAGRRKEFARFPQFSDPQARERIPDPNDPATYASAALDWSRVQAPGHQAWLALHRDLLALRRREIVPRLAGIRGAQARFELLSERALAVHWRLGDGAELGLLANLSADPIEVPVPPAAPLLFATPPDAAETLRRGQLPPWTAIWSLTDAPR